MSKLTIGEVLARRKLKLRNTRSPIKYESGQGKVSKLGDEDALVSYVTVSGDLTIIPVELRDEEWFQRGITITADATTAEIRNVPRQAPLRSEVVTLLRAAFVKDEAPPPPDTNDGGAGSQDPESGGPGSG